MGVKYQTLSNWLNGRNDFPSAELAKIAKLTSYSLNWILTGEGPKIARETPTQPSSSGIFNEEELRRFVREILQDELSKATVQDLGSVDAFDLAEAVERLNDPQVIMDEWYRAENRRPPRDYGVVFFRGWENLTDKEKIDALRDARSVLERAK